MFKIKNSYLGKKLYTFFNKKWFFDKIYNEYFGQFFFKFGYSISYKFVDRGIFEVLGPSGISSVVLQVASNLHKLQSGYLYHYSFSILVGASLLFTIRGLWLFFGYYIDYRIFILFFVILFFLSNFKKD